MKAMEHFKTDDVIAAVIGAIVGLFSTAIMNITLKDVLENAAHLLWVGLIALFTGAMSVLGKYLIEKFIKRNKKIKQ